MNLRILLLIIFWTGQMGLLLAQQSPNSLLWKVTDNNAVLLKWYGPEIYTTENVNVYRKPINADNRAWTKINGQPIRMLDAVPGAGPNSDERLYAEAIKRGVDPAAKAYFNLLMLLKSFESTPFSLFLGAYFEDSTISTGQVYQYKIRLIKRNGSEEDFATSSAVDTGNPTPFPPPQKIEADGVNGKISFKWQVESKRYYGVNIYRSEERSGNFSLINDRPILISKTEKEDGTTGYPEIFYTDDSLELRKTYYFYLEARGFFADSSQRSEIIEVLVRDEIPPLPVRGLASERPDKEALDIKLTWLMGTDTDLAGYLVQRKVIGEFATVSPLIPADQITYIDKVPRTESYLYRIVTVDISGNQTPGQDIIVKVNDNTPPHQPQNLKSEGLEGAIKLTWDANTDSDLMGYFVYRMESGYRDREMMLLNSDFLTTPVFIDSLPKIAKNTFVYRVSAIDSSYNIGPKSEISEGKMPDVTAPVVPFIRRGYLLEDTIRIEWLPNLDMDLAGYELYRSLDQETPNWISMRPAGLLDTATLHFEDVNWEHGVTYIYQLFAQDWDRNRSEPSNIYKVTASPPVAQVSPAPKLSLDYDKKKNALKIKWKSDKNEAITGMHLFRKEGIGRYIPWSGISDKQQEFTDTDIEIGKTYTYQLRTYYSDGNITLSDPQGLEVKK